MQELDKRGIVTITRAIKTCVGCSESKALDEFGFHPHTKDRHKRECKGCASKKVMVQWRKRKGEAEPVADVTPAIAVPPAEVPVVTPTATAAAAEPTLRFQNPNMGMDPKLIALSVRVRELGEALAAMNRQLTTAETTVARLATEAEERVQRIDKLTAEAAEWQAIAEEATRPKADPVSVEVSVPKAPPSEPAKHKQIARLTEDVSSGLPSGYPAWFNQLPGRFLKQAIPTYGEVGELLHRTGKRLSDGQLRAIFDAAMTLAIANLPTGPDQPVVFRKLVKVMVDPHGQAEETFSIHHKGNTTDKTLYKARTGYYRMGYHIENGQPKFLKIGHRRDFYEDVMFGGMAK